MELAAATGCVSLPGLRHGCRDGTPPKQGSFPTLPTLSPRDSLARGDVQGVTDPVENQSKNEHSVGLVFAISMYVLVCSLGICIWNFIFMILHICFIRY